MSGGPAIIDPPTPWRLLLSYHYFRSLDARALLDELTPDVPQGVELFADSGAYSALTQGQPVVLDDYARWITANREAFAVYANLDAIGDGERSAAESWDNQKRLEEVHGLNPLPVFHAGEPFDWLERYLDAGYTYIALGGLVGRTAPAMLPWAVRCFRMAEGRAVFHGFGVTSWRMLSTLPWYSVDSSSWAQILMYGSGRLFDPTTGRQTVVSVGDHGKAFRHAGLIRRYGEDPALLAESKSLTYKDDSRRRASFLVARAWRQTEAWIARRHGPIVMPPGRCDQPRIAGDPVGLRLYLVQMTVPDLRCCLGLNPHQQEATTA